MHASDLKNLIESQLENASVTITSKDNVHFQAEIICPLFKDKSLLEQQKLVYKTVQHLIESREIHALSMKTRAA